MAAKLKTLPAVTVATSGTKVQLVSSLGDTVTKVFITCTGAGPVYIGDANVAVGRGVAVAANATYSIFAEEDIIDLVSMYVDGPTGATISVSYLTRT